jgi:hypothetical protein
MVQKIDKTNIIIDFMGFLLLLIPTILYNNNNATKHAKSTQINPIKTIPKKTTKKVCPKTGEQNVVK